MNKTSDLMREVRSPVETNDQANGTQKAANPTLAEMLYLALVG